LAESYDRRRPSYKAFEHFAIFVETESAVNEIERGYLMNDEIVVTGMVPIGKEKRKKINETKAIFRVNVSKKSL
jgi:hypothetical protein